MSKFIKTIRWSVKQSYIYLSWALKRATTAQTAAQVTPKNAPRPVRGRTVFVAERDLPSPDRDAGSRTIFEFLKCLVDSGWNVYFWPLYGYDEPAYSGGLRALGIDVISGFFRPGLKRWLRRNGAEIDAFFVGRPEVAEAYLDDIRAVSVAPIVYYGHDLHFARLKMQAEVQHDESLLAEVERTKALEKSIWRRSSVSLYPSKDEMVAAKAVAPDAAVLDVTPFCFDTFAARTQANSGFDIVFVAGFRHQPNIDAAVWFVTEIFPKIRARYPQARIHIAGSSPGKAVRDLAGDGVDVLGWVSEEALAALYQKARVAVVPLRFGAGMKLKVVEALVNGIPLVTTTVGAQGLEAVEDLIRVCDDSESFAAEVGRVFALTPDEWVAQSARQAAYAEKWFSRASMSRSLDRAFLAAGVAGTRSE